MNIALIGYGQMGKAVEQAALRRGHRIVCVIEKDDEQKFASHAFRSADVAIEFTTPQTAAGNIHRAWDVCVPVVCGTTGWDMNEMLWRKEAEERKTALLWASNFSLGVHLFMDINRRLAELMNRYSMYDVALTETHHIRKKDAPSGTAITLAEDILHRIDRKTQWQLGHSHNSENIDIEVFRQGDVPGTHSVIYDSAADSITITHMAKGREGFAEGAVIAAEFIVGKTGVFSMNDVLQL